MSENTKKDYLNEEDYNSLVVKIKKEFPNIILPSMGMLPEEKRIDINGKDYIVSDEVKEN